MKRTISQEVSSMMNKCILMIKKLQTVSSYLIIHLTTKTMIGTLKTLILTIFNGPHTLTPMHTHMDSLTTPITLILDIVSLITILHSILQVTIMIIVMAISHTLTATVKLIHHNIPQPINHTTECMPTLIPISLLRK